MPTFTPAALKSELLTDPAALGYAPFIASGGDSDLVELLNRVRATVSIFRDDVAASEVLAALVKADWDALAAGDKQLFQAIVAAQMLNVTSASLRNMMAALFPPASATRANLITVASRQGSRMEQLFGLHVTASILDVALALRG